MVKMVKCSSNFPCNSIPASVKVETSDRPKTQSHVQNRKPILSPCVGSKISNWKMCNGTSKHVLSLSCAIQPLRNQYNTTCRLHGVIYTDIIGSDYD